MENFEKYLKARQQELLNAKYTFSDLFFMIHDQDDRIFCEYIENFRIKEFSYSNMKKYIYKLANYLNEKISLNKGEFVGLLMDNSVNFIASFWALLMIGYKPLLINAKLPLSLNFNVMNMANCNYVLTETTFADYKLCENTLILEHSLGPNSEILQYEELKEPTWEDEIALSTTATTLNVKICVYKGSDFTHQIQNTNGILAKNKMIKGLYKGKMKLLTFLPFYHIFGLVATYFWFSLFGRTMVFLNDYSVNTILKTIVRHEVTHVFGVPLLWHSLHREIIKEVKNKDEKTQKKFNFGMKLSYFVQKLFPKFGLKLAKRLFKEVHAKTFGTSIKFMISGGSYIQQDALRDINLLGYPLYVGYGSTEMGITSVELRKNVKHRISGSIGQPFDSVSYKIEDDILKVRGKSLCSRIISKDSVTIMDHEAWFNTNDIASVDKKNNYYILGRNDDVYIGNNGEKINPDLIEKQIKFTTIDRFSILSLEVENKKELSLVLEIKSSINGVIINKIISEVEENLKKIQSLNYNVEKVYFTFDDIANKNAIKVSRSALLKGLNEGSINISSIEKLYPNKKENTEVLSREVCDEVRKQIAIILNKNVDEIKDDSNFIFDLGGTSLDYYTLLTELKNIYQIEFDFKEHSCQTPIEFSNYIVNVGRRG